jgi:hypothetical protein
MNYVRNSTSSLQLLSELLLSPDSGRQGSTSRQVKRLSAPELDHLQALAMTNHVIIRSFPQLASACELTGDFRSASWLSSQVQKESARIHHALPFLERICRTLEQKGCPAIVIKSLDHWPDLGSDLDLYAGAPSAAVIGLMTSEFNATVADRSWGDRLANKWNFVVPGLPELVEIHIGRLGQTGEQTALTRSLSARARTLTIGRGTFRVAAPEDRIVISTLQRMYRHFYIRLCDIVDNARLLDAREVDFEYLHTLGSSAGLWEGIATYLNIVSQYVEAYRGVGVPLPALVTGSARFGREKIFFRRDFLRVPIVPQSINLYAGELKTLLLRGELRNTLRLSLLPGLATAAALEQKITGSDKGIW